LTTPFIEAERGRDGPAPERPDAPPGRRIVTVDGNEAVARVAYRLSDVIAIYPITPSSPMGELADAWAAAGRKNLWNAVPDVTEMQSEAGAAGAVHGALQAGALASTFTSSQGLLLMIPNMYKIAGELTPSVFHVAARTVATHALSIFGDHSDVMAARTTGFAMLSSGSVQEAHDLALVAHAATLEARIPFLHFFDGFRTSHELNRIELLGDDDIRALIDEPSVQAHHDRRLTPDHPVLRGTAQNPDVFFQAREAVTPYYAVVPDIVQQAMDRLGDLIGRRYAPYEYVGAPDAERVIVLMGSAAGAVEETIEALSGRGERIGLVKVRLFRPFSARHLVAALPPTVRRVAVLDRTKEPGAAGEPLYEDVVTALSEQTASGAAPFAMPVVGGGRYGLASKEFTPAMAATIFAELDRPEPKNHFTVGITDDVSGTSLHVDRSFSTEADDVVRAVFYGLGSDGTVGANKNSVKIIGESTPLYAQGYFVYDSRKAGAVTISHLRFGPRPIRSSYLIERAGFVACHQFHLLAQMDVLHVAEPGATFLLNSPYAADEVWDKLPVDVQREIIDKRLRFYVVDGYRIAREVGLGARINTVLQTCFFALSGVLPYDEAIAAIKERIQKTYAKSGEEVLAQNSAAVDRAVGGMQEVQVPEEATSTIQRRELVPADAPDFVKRVTGMILAGQGDLLPVSALPADGTFPTATSRFDKRGTAVEIPIWDPELCIDCGKCTLVCPHAALRMKVFPPADVDEAPPGFRTKAWRGKDLPDKLLAIQVAPDDCTGCTLCVDVCPVQSKTEHGHKAINMAPREDHSEVERAAFEFFLDIPDIDRRLVKHDLKGSQLLRPLFEFSTACKGCGETPYLKLLTQLFGDRIVVANATGCSSIYGGNLPTTPWSAGPDGRGPAWSNSLFEDNAEFGLGMRLAIDHQLERARFLLEELAGSVGEEFARQILEAAQDDEGAIADQRERVTELQQRLSVLREPEAAELASIADVLVRKSVWIVGGDGWAYDIGFGGLDHVLASGRDVNVLVLDTEVYSNTGGQSSKATPRGAMAKFASGGKASAKKDLGLIAMTYGDVYVAQVAMGAKDVQTVKAFEEAEAYAGASLIIAYSHCIEHGYDISHGLGHQKSAVDTGYWPLYRFDPRTTPSMQLDSKRPSSPVSTFELAETRFSRLSRTQADRASELLELAQSDIDRRWELYEQLARIDVEAPKKVEHHPPNGGPEAAGEP
jgi:pyruvate-ferredoxin/flavodoxin oxidoreductase